MSAGTEPIPNWLELPTEVTTNILERIGVVDILENAQKVCPAWRKICKDPAMWKVVNMDAFPLSNLMPCLIKMCKHVVDLSQGQLVDFTIVDFANGDLLMYLAERSSQLKRLEVAFCFDNVYESLTEVLKNFPLLEELNLYSTKVPKEAIITAGSYCPMLKSLKVNQKAFKFWSEDLVSRITIWNEMAVAIGENLVELRHLELIGSNMSNVGLQAILDGCRHLESLDLRMCWYIDLEGDLGKRCFEQIKHLKLPDDSLEGCPYLYISFYTAANDDAGHTEELGLPLQDDFEDDLYEDVDIDYVPTFKPEEELKVYAEYHTRKAIAVACKNKFVFGLAFETQPKYYKLEQFSHVAFVFCSILRMMF